VTERLEPERVDREAVEADLESEAQAQGGQSAGVQVVLDRDRADQAAGVQVVLHRDRAGQMAEVRVVWVQDRADRVAADQAAGRKRLAPGPELAATMAARVLFRVWSPALRVEALVGAANRQKKNFSEFSGR
jgi:hypothetical protein